MRGANKKDHTDAFVCFVAGGATREKSTSGRPRKKMLGADPAVKKYLACVAPKLFGILLSLSLWVVAVSVIAENEKYLMQGGPMAAKNRCLWDMTRTSLWATHICVCQHRENPKRPRALVRFFRPFVFSSALPQKNTKDAVCFFFFWIYAFLFQSIRTARQKIGPDGWTTTRRRRSGE